MDIEGRVLQFLNKEIHLVCMASINFPVDASPYLLVTKIPDSQLTIFCDKVNMANESGYLYPKYNLTIVPKIIQSNDKLQLHKILKDVVMANETYFMSNTIYFDIKKVLGNEYETITAEITKFFEENVGEIKYLKNVCL
jgi:hypothetical protein